MASDTRVRGDVLARLQDDPAAIARAERAVGGRHRAGRSEAQRAEEVTKELAAQAERRVDPVMDYIFGVLVGTVARAPHAVIADPPEEDVVAPSGTVPQPVQGP